MIKPEQSRQELNPSSYLDSTPTELRVQPTLTRGSSPTEVFDLNLTKLQDKALKFFSEPTIPFKPRKGVKLDDGLSKLVKRMNLRVPVIHVKDNQYLVGSQKVNLEIKNSGELMMVHRNSRKSLEKFVQQHEFKMMELLYSETKETKTSLSNVCTRLLKGMKLRSRRALALQDQINSGSPDPAPLNTSLPSKLNASAMQPRYGGSDKLSQSQQSSVLTAALDSQALRGRDKAVHAQLQNLYSKALQQQSQLSQAQRESPTRRPAKK
jgi:hypothetical protein